MQLIEPTQFVRLAPQVQRHELARFRQFIDDMAWQSNHLYQSAMNATSMMKTPEESQTAYSLLLQYNQQRDQIASYIALFNQLVGLLNDDFSSRLSDQCKREIYHLYHAGRYTQEQLAAHYGTSQTTVNRIVTGPTPQPVSNVNPNGIAG